MKKILKSITTSLLFTLPLSAFADIHISNHSHGTVTAKLKNNPTCSSSVSANGILHPNGTLKVPQGIIDLFCTFSDCEVDVYLSKNCTGLKIADAKVNSAQGISHVSNYTNNYKLNGYGNYAIIEDAQ